MLHDTSFWVALAVVAFAVVFWFKGRGPVLALIDARTAKIKADLEEAARLKDEAQALLNDSQRKHRDALHTSQKILDDAKAIAARMQKDAEQKLSADMQRREQQLLDRIARAETQAVQDIRNHAADLAAAAAGHLLEDMMGKQDVKLIDDAVVKLASVRL